MHKVPLAQTHDLSKYSKLIHPRQIDELKQLASALAGKKIVEINATSFGGGVAELLRSQVPLMRELGIDVDWYVLPPNDQFFDITKELHNCLQGICPLQSNVDIDFYQAYSDEMAKQLPEADIYILHDPQTLGLAKHLVGKKVIWRCHIDLTSAELSTHKWLQQHYRYFSKVIFSLESYVHGLQKVNTAIVHPAIDPFSIKNSTLTKQQCYTILSKYHIDQNRPYILQVSRFDKFKDPLGVINIFSQLQKIVPSMRCVLMGNYATDDPEGLEYYREVHKVAKKIDPHNIHIIVQSDDVTINAFQQQATVVLQNSTKEGFGLTVTEALWKKKIVFSRPVGGIALQILNGKTGYYLSDTNIKSAHKIAQVLASKNEDKQRITQAAYDHVKNNFITPIMIQDYLMAYSSVL